MLNSRLECKNHTLFKSKIAKIDSLQVSQTKMAKKNYTIWSRAYAHSPYEGVHLENKNTPGVSCAKPIQCCDVEDPNKNVILATRLSEVSKQKDICYPEQGRQRQLSSAMILSLGCLEEQFHLLFNLTEKFRF